jgi:hypothetical protein
MPRSVKPGGGANQDQKEKKDTEQHPRGRSEDSDFTDPQANQAKGRRSQPKTGTAGEDERKRSAQGEATPTNNTTSGGNRPKVPQRTDHN